MYNHIYIIYHLYSLVAMSMGRCLSLIPWPFALTSLARLALGDREAEDNHQDGAENEGRDDQGVVLQAPQHFQPLKPGGSSWGFQKRNMGNTMGIVFPNDFIP